MDKEATSIDSQLIAYSFFNTLFLKHHWLLTVFTNQHSLSHWLAEAHKVTNGGMSSPQMGFLLLLCFCVGGTLPQLSIADR